MTRETYGPPESTINAKNVVTIPVNQPNLENLGLSVECELRFRLTLNGHKRTFSMVVLKRPTNGPVAQLVRVLA